MRYSLPCEENRGLQKLFQERESSSVEQDIPEEKEKRVSKNK
jgi:hypothetical protein